MSTDIDMEILISLVQERPVIWDKTSELYKNRDETKKAWQEIFLAVKNNFEELEEGEKKNFGKC